MTAGTAAFTLSGGASTGTPVGAITSASKFYHIAGTLWLLDLDGTMTVAERANLTDSLARGTPGSATIAATPVTADFV